MAPPRVFVSHSHLDNDFCRRFVNALIERGYAVWYDEHNLRSGPLRDAIDRELVARQHFIVIFSPAALQSQWVKDEMEGALKRFHQGKMQTFLPVVAQRCDVPPSLERYMRIEGPNGAPVSVAEAVARAVKAIPLPEPPPVIERQAPQRVAPKPAPPPAVPIPHRAPVAAEPTLTRRTLLTTGLTVGTVAALGGGFYLIARRNSGQSNTPSLVYPSPPLPNSLAQLGFALKTINGVQVIIPPVVNVPAGPFIMGSDPAKDPLAHSDELPQSTITIAQPYQIGQYHVTVAEYALAMRAGAVAQPPDTDSNGASIPWQTQLNNPDHPVVNVSWSDVVKYVAWLAQVTGEPWRLPTEAEWEKAARGTDGRIYPWGNTFDPAKANTAEGGKGTTTPVGAYASAGDASPYGAHDMTGNALQWCSTIYYYTQYPYPYNATDGRENMSDKTSARVLRGGSWYNLSRYARAALRYVSGAFNTDHGVGLRVVRGSGAGSG